MRDANESDRERAPHLGLLFGDQVLDRQAINCQTLMGTITTGTPCNKKIGSLVRSAGNNVDQLTVAGIDLI